MSKVNIHHFFDKANVAWEKKNFKEALKLFMKAADQGDMYALNSIGYFFDKGIGVPKNNTKALIWYKRAARRGDITAYTNIGTVYRDMGRLDLALFWFQKAFIAGDGDAALELSMIYLEKKNPLKAIYYLKLVKKSKRVTSDSRLKAERLLKKISSTS